MTDAEREGAASDEGEGGAAGVPDGIPPARSPWRAEGEDDGTPFPFGGPSGETVDIGCEKGERRGVAGWGRGAGPLAADRGEKNGDTGEVDICFPPVPVVVGRP